MNYKKEIQRMISRIPPSVTNGSYNKATEWKAAMIKGSEVVRKTRASEADLARAYAALIIYE